MGAAVQALSAAPLPTDRAAARAALGNAVRKVRDARGRLEDDGWSPFMGAAKSNAIEVCKAAESACAGEVGRLAGAGSLTSAESGRLRLRLRSAAAAVDLSADVLDVPAMSTEFLNGLYATVAAGDAAVYDTVKGVDATVRGAASAAGELAAGTLRTVGEGAGALVSPLVKTLWPVLLLAGVGLGLYVYIQTRGVRL
jgi:hypothetical protein